MNVVNIILIILILIFTIIILYFNKRNVNSRIPGPRGILFPIFGNLFSLKGELHLILQDWSKQYGPIYRLKLGNIETIIISDYPTLKKAFIENSSAFSSRYQFKSRILLNGCQGVVWENGEKHCILKKIILREMASNKIKRMENQISNQLEKLIVLLDKHADTGNPFPLNGYISLFSINIVINFIFGVDNQFGKVEDCESLINSIKQLFKVVGPILTDFLPISQPRSTISYIDKYNNVIKQIDGFIQNYINDPNSNKDSIIGKLIQESNKGTIKWESVIDSVTSLVQAGSDSTSNTVIFTIIEIINNQEIQDKLNIELVSTNSAKTVTHSNYRSVLPYLSMVIKEAYRKYPVTVLGLPHKTTEQVEINGFKIAPNTLVFQNIWASHRSENYFKNPNTFIPERFLENQNLVTFGIGVRNCFGSTLADCMIFSLLSTLIKRYEFINPTSLHPLNDIGKFGLVLQPDITNIIIKKRKN